MDWIGHHNDIAHWGAGMDASGPEEVEAIGWTQSSTDVETHLWITKFDVSTQACGLGDCFPTPHGHAVDREGWVAGIGAS